MNRGYIQALSEVSRETLEALHTEIVESIDDDVLRKRYVRHHKTDLRDAIVEARRMRAARLSGDDSSRVGAWACRHGRIVQAQTELA